MLRYLIIIFSMWSVVRLSAATFTWTNVVGGNASGSWTNQANWSGAVLPTTTADTVNFNALNISANSTVTLNGSQSVNVLNFGDTDASTAANWIVKPGSPASVLTLGGTSPKVNVTGLGSGSAAVLSTVINGTAGFTKVGTSYLQLTATNTYSGTTILSGTDCRVSFTNNYAFGGGTIQVGGSVGDGECWFNAAGARTLTNAMEIRTIRWIIDSSTVNGITAGDLTVGGSVVLNNGSSNVRDIYCNKNLTINGNLSVTPANNPLNKQGGGKLTLNGTNTVGGASAVNAGTLAVNGPMNGGATFTVNAGGTLTGTGVFSGTISVTNGGILAAGSNGCGTTTCGQLMSYSGANLNFSFGATNNSTNGFIKVNGNVTLAGLLNITDLGGFNPGVYTGLQYSGSVTLNNLAANNIPGGKSLVVDTNTPGYVLFDVLNGSLNPANGQAVPMDVASPLALNWLEVPDSTAYDVYFGTTSNSVAGATTNTMGVYQGHTNGLTMNISGLQPNTTYFWRVDSVAANGSITPGVVMSFTTGAPMVDLMEDTWVAADALNRSLPDLAECGSPRTNRPIGLLYSLWQKASVFGSGTNWDVSQYLTTYPYANPHNPWANNPVFQTAIGATFWWGQPELGYYDPSDPWVLRRQIALLNHAGVDVLIFDYSNSQTYDTQLYALCDVIRQMRCEGYKINLKITFLTHSISGTQVTYLYNTLYGPGKYSDLWYYWQGKPLILGYVNGSGGGDIVPSSTVQNFFTWRTSWAYVATNALQDEWQWIDKPTPQNWGYDARYDLPEELPVACGGWAQINIGRSQANNLQQDYDNQQLPLQHTSPLGIFFSEQMNYGLKYDPQFLFVAGWNEWIAGVQSSPSACATTFLADCCPANGFYFVDQYNEEYSRDLEPMKGGHTDNYYFQLVAQDRLRKGIRPVPPASAPRTIDLAGGFAQWNTVGPTYYDPANDTIWRNFSGASSQMGTYTNYSGRNDLTQMKVARDANNFYFFAQCNSNITSYTGSNWMVLFIDNDKNHLTGWEGYDYAVNLGGVGPSTTTLWQNTTTTDAWAWTPVRSDIAYTVSGNQLMLTVPRVALGLSADPVQFDFHWTDNFQTNDIADFGVDGDSAPDGRFNYRYTTTTNTEVVVLADDFEFGKQGVWGETWTNGSSWNLTTSNPYSGSYCAVCTNGVGQSNLIARVSTAGYGNLRLKFYYKLHGVANAQNLMLYYQGVNGWVSIRELSRDEYYPANQSWGYDERQDVWLNFTDTRVNSGPDAQFFTTNFAFRIDGSAVTSSAMNVWVDDVSLTATTDLPATIPPGTWQTCDIGHAGNMGGVLTNASMITETGSGMDIGNNGDAFRFMYQTRNGDGILTARVTSQTASNPGAKAGVMIRESLDSGARQAMMAITPSNNAAFVCRSAALGGSSSKSFGTGLTLPYWVRLVRTGTNLSSYASADGTTWSPAGSTNFAGFNPNALWGLAVTAHNNNTNSTAVFDNVTLTQTPVIAAIASQTLVAGQTLVLTNTLLNPDTPPATLTWALVSAPSGMTLGSSGGVLNWRPTIAQSPATNMISLKVSDSGSPALSATQSFTATVSLPTTPTFSALSWSNGVFGFTVNGDKGPDYEVLGSTNLFDWFLLQQLNSPVTPFQFVDPVTTNYNQRFYKIQLVP
jgi:autotransporter-associated beta strand protein